MSKRRLTGASLGPSKGTSIVVDPLEIRHLLTRAAEGRTAATLKIRGSETALRTQLIDVDARQDGIQLLYGDSETSLNRETFDAAAEATGSRECMVLIYLPGRSIIGMNAEPSEFQEDRLVFSLPTKLFKIQRRKDVRFLIPQAYEFTVEFDSLEQAGTRIKKKLIDISESGLSFFILSPREVGFFKKGLIIPRATIQMHNQLINVEMCVCNHTRLERVPQGPGNKVGVEFTEISPDDKNYLGQFVYSHAHHLFY
jgi:hypothetical protein